MKFIKYYGKYKRKNNLVLPNIVIQKSKTLQVRMDNELYSNVENLAKELNQTVSKVTKDILEDFFLDQKLKQQQFELEGL